MGIWSYIGRRLVQSILVLLLVTVATFALAHAVPGDPIETVLGERAAGDPEVRAAAERRYESDRPIHLQYVYFLRNLFRGDLGESISTRRAVMDDLRQFVPGTIELVVAAMLFAYCTGIDVCRAPRRRGAHRNDFFVARYRTLQRSSRVEARLSRLTRCHLVCGWGLCDRQLRCRRRLRDTRSQDPDFVGDSERGRHNDLARAGERTWYASTSSVAARKRRQHAARAATRTGWHWHCPRVAHC